MSIWWRPRDCVLWFDFAELKGDTVYDLSGNGNHGKIYGAQWRRGPLIGSLYFDGADDYLYVADSLYDFLNPYTITVELLVNPSRPSVDGFFSILRITPDVAGPNHMIALTDGCVDVCHPDDTRTRLAVALPKRWTHIVIRYGVGEVYDVWIDGKLHASSTDFTKEMKYWKYPSYFAMFRPGDPKYFLGEWGMVRVYNRLLTEEEIKSHYRYLMGRVGRIRRRFTE